MLLQIFEEMVKKRCSTLFPGVATSKEWNLDGTEHLIRFPEIASASVMVNTSDEHDGILRSISDTPPTHHTVKVESFSLLANSNVQIYESNSFNAGGYKWKLVLHPGGNKNKNVKDHFSIYLAISEPTSLPPGWEVYVNFRLFLLDQNKNNYLTLEEDTLGEGKRFHGMKLEWGFDHFIPLNVFGDALNGYLVEDCCVFGAEVFVLKERSKEQVECLTMIKDTITYKHIWRIEKYMSTDAVCYKEFNAGNRKWKMKLYCNGTGSGTGTHLSLYLVLADTDLPPTSKIFAEYTLRMLDQVNAKHQFGKASYWFSGLTEERGWDRFTTMGQFYGPRSGLLNKDTCIIEAEITTLAITNALT